MGPQNSLNYNCSLGFKEFESVKRTFLGIEIISMIKKNQLLNPKNSAFESFKSLTI